VQAVTGNALCFRLFEERLDTAKMAGIDVDRHLQPIVELAEI